MKQNSVSQSGIFAPRALVAFALCACGIFLGVLSFAATPPARTAPSAPNNTNHLPSGVPLPESAQISPLPGGTWSIVDTPNSNPTPTDNLPGAVTCVSASDCWAVGYYSNGGTNQTLIEHWDGSAWSVVASPNTSATQANLLRSVTCTSASDCWAVGSFDNGSATQTLIEHWDGASWSIVASPNTSASQANFLASVTCTSASNCWAVGSYNSGIYHTLIERWNGTVWAIVTSPNTSATQNNFLNGVTCSSASDCWAVGSYNAATAEQTLIQRWNGTAWAVVTSVNTLPTQNNILLRVTCVSASDCWAVGYANNGTADQMLFEHWNGTLWTVASAPITLPTQSSILVGLTCTSASDCWAVGYTGSVPQTLITRWDGSSWSIVTSPNTLPTQSNILLGMACTSASNCWAVGYYYNGSFQQSLIQRWNGTAWSIVTSANAAAAKHNTLLGVTCASASDCWAVASFNNGSVQQTLIEHWDGTSWTIAPSPNTSVSQSNILYSVTCASGSDCWAVGYYHNGSFFQTLTLHWNGTAWNIVSSPNPVGSQNNFLNDVTCTSASDCWAVGFYDTGSGYQTLIERWNGSAWNIVASPNSSVTEENRLFGVTCASASDCWAVGRHVLSGGISQNLIEHWDGTSWAIVASPNTSATQNNIIQAVACSSASDCWAVGSWSTGSGTGRTLIERWDGTAWSIVASPDPTANPLKYIFLRDVACTSASDCWTVGYYFTGGVYQTLVEHWNGAAWAIFSSPNTSTEQNNYLFGIACPSATDCRATGYHYNESAVFRTLMEHYTTTPPPILTGVASRKTHGAAGDFEIDLPLGETRGIECRSGGANGDFTLVFTFANPLTSVDSAGVSAGTGSVSGSAIGPDPRQYVVNLTGVANAQTISVSLVNVHDNAGAAGNVAAGMDVLLGDTTASRSVNSSDIGEAKGNSGQVTNSKNFRTDVTANGVINSSDIGTIKAQSGAMLPP